MVTRILFLMGVLFWLVVLVCAGAGADQLSFNDIKLPSGALENFTLLKEQELPQGWQACSMQGQEEEGQDKDLPHLAIPALKQDWVYTPPRSSSPDPYPWLVQYGIFSGPRQARAMLEWEVTRRLTPPFFLPQPDYSRKVREVPGTSLGDASTLLAEEFGEALYVCKGRVLILVYGNQEEEIKSIAEQILTRVPEEALPAEPSPEPTPAPAPQPAPEPEPEPSPSSAPASHAPPGY